MPSTNLKLEDTSGYSKATKMAQKAKIPHHAQPQLPTTMLRASWSVQPPQINQSDQF